VDLSIDVEESNTNSKKENIDTGSEWDEMEEDEDMEEELYLLDIIKDISSPFMKTKV